MTALDSDSARDTRWESQEEREGREQGWQRGLQNPQLREQLDDINRAVGKGDLTLAQVGGFTPNELDSAYAAALKLVGIGKLDEALQIAGYLILIDPWNAQHYYLAGVCFLHKSQFEMAEKYLAVALGFGEEQNALFARGEALLMLGQNDEAKRCLERGLAIGGRQENTLEPHVARALQLLTTYLQGGAA